MKIFAPFVRIATKLVIQALGVPGVLELARSDTEVSFEKIAESGILQSFIRCPTSYSNPRSHSQQRNQLVIRTERNYV